MDFCAECDMLGKTPQELKDLVKQMGIPAFKGGIIFDRLQQGIVDYAQMSSLSITDRRRLAEEHPVSLPRQIAEQQSQDQSCAKLLLDFGQNVQIELVIMNYERKTSKTRHTLCISTQAGCAMGCAFCATGLGGLYRNLLAGEIVAQVLCGKLWLNSHSLGEVTNIVFMGMGEPFANYDEIMRAITLLNHPNGLNLGQRRMTVSTCGLVPYIKRFADEAGEVNLAISLHAANDGLRNKLMPINRRYPLSELLAACDYYTEKTHRRISYEYALLAGVNDTERDADELVRLLAGKLAHINLIPVNFVEETGFYPSDDETISRFAERLNRHGIETSVREKRGTDIDGACGQLRRMNMQI